MAGIIAPKIDAIVGSVNGRINRVCGRVDIPALAHNLWILGSACPHLSFFWFCFGFILILILLDSKNYKPGIRRKVKEIQEREREKERERESEGNKLTCEPSAIETGRIID